MNENENRLLAMQLVHHKLLSLLFAHVARTTDEPEAFIKQLSQEVSASMAQATDKVSDHIPSNEVPMRNELLANAIETMQVLEQGAMAELRYQEGH